MTFSIPSFDFSEVYFESQERGNYFSCNFPSLELGIGHAFFPDAALHLQYTVSCEKKKRQIISRVLSPLLKNNAVIYHLSCSKLTLGIHQPTLRDRTSSPLCIAAILGLFGLSVRKVYLAFHIAVKAVSSYLTFSPFPLRKRSGSFPFCGTFCSRKIPFSRPSR